MLIRAGGVNTGEEGTDPLTAGMSTHERDVATGPTEERPFAIVVTSVTHGTRLSALMEALATQAGLARRRIPVFAAVGDRLGAAGLAFESVRDASALELHLFERPAESVRGDDCRDALQAATYYLERQAGGPSGVLLICDAAALPAADWIATNLRTLTTGVDLVLASHVLAARPGRSRISSAVSMVGLLARYHRLAVRLEDAIDPVPWDPAPRHGYETGASLALTLSTFRLAGGAPNVPTGMARHLIARVRQCGGTARHCPRSRVFVPPHLLGGFDAAGRSAAPDLPFLVTDPEQLESVFRHRAALRAQLTERYRLLAAAERDRTVRSSLALATPAEIVSPGGMPVEQACHRLSARLEQLERKSWRQLSREPLGGAPYDERERQARPV